MSSSKIQVLKLNGQYGGIKREVLSKALRASLSLYEGFKTLVKETSSSVQASCLSPFHNMRNNILPLQKIQQEGAILDQRLSL
jgi:hypothetical protein